MLPTISAAPPNPFDDGTKKPSEQLDPKTAERIELETNELKRLRKEIAQLRTENEILKKATAYFAKEVM